MPGAPGKRASGGKQYVADKECYGPWEGFARPAGLISCDLSITCNGRPCANDWLTGILSTTSQSACVGCARRSRSSSSAVFAPVTPVRVRMRSSAVSELARPKMSANLPCRPTWELLVTPPSHLRTHLHALPYAHADLLSRPAPARPSH